MALESQLAVSEELIARIHIVRGQRVMLDSDLAEIYGVTTAALNQALKRNFKRFPLDFAFVLKPQEFAILKSQIVISKGQGGRRSLPWVFTEHGSIMLASILNSKQAVEMSVFVVRAFVQMRAWITGNEKLAAKLDELEKRITGHDEVIADLLLTIRKLVNPSVEERPRREIGFDVKNSRIKANLTA